MNSDCEHCENNRYFIKGCCSGHECGCLGQPTNITNCPHCNPESDLSPGKGIADIPYFRWLEFRPSKPPVKERKE